MLDVKTDPLQRPIELLLKQPRALFSPVRPAWRVLLVCVESGHSFGQKFTEVRRKAKAVLLLDPLELLAAQARVRADAGPAETLVHFAGGHFLHGES